MNIRKALRKDGRPAWKLEWVIGKDPATGKYRRISETVEGTKTFAKEYWQRRHTELTHQRDAGIHPSRQVLRDYLTEWLETIIRQERRPKTYRSYEQLIRIHIIPGLGSLRVDQLTAAQIREWMVRLGRPRTEGGAGLSPASVTRCHAVLRAALAELVRREELEVNPCQKVRAPKHNAKPIQPYTREECRAILTSATGTRWETLITMAIGSGLRLGELLALRWADIQLERQTLVVTRNLTDVANAERFGGPKTVEGLRTVALPPMVMAALRVHRKTQVEERLAAGDRWKDYDLVFCTHTGRPLLLRNVQRAWYAIRQKSQVPAKGFHALRHSYASVAISAGIPLEAIAELLGHADPTFTKRIYAHLLEEAKHHVADQWQVFLETGERPDRL